MKGLFMVVCIKNMILFTKYDYSISEVHAYWDNNNLNKYFVK